MSTTPIETISEPDEPVSAGGQPPLSTTPIDTISEPDEPVSRGIQSPVLVTGAFMTPLDWTRITVGVLLLGAFLVTVVIAGIGWLNGADVATFLPVISAVSTLMAAATGYFFAERRQP